MYKCIRYIPYMCLCVFFLNFFNLIFFFIYMYDDF